jgi:hypothetical protein
MRLQHRLQRNFMVPCGSGSATLRLSNRRFPLRIDVANTELTSCVPHDIQIQVRKYRHVKNPGDFLSKKIDNLWRKPQIFQTLHNNLEIGELPFHMPLPLAAMRELLIQSLVQILDRSGTRGQKTQLKIKKVK